MTGTEPAGDGRKIPIALNPFRWLPAEEAMRPMIRVDPNWENLLGFLRGPFAQPVLDEFVQRYRILTPHDAKMFAVPIHHRILRGVLQPLHNAKAAFVLGHFAGCIGLCGVAAEMLAVFRFDIAEFQIGDQPFDEERQSDLWGMKFERLNQAVRCSALLALGLIDRHSLDLFKRVYGLRNKYVHVLSRKEEHEEADATQVYAATSELTVRILGIGVEDSKLTLHPDVTRFLQHSNDHGRRD